MSTSLYTFSVGTFTPTFQTLIHILDLAKAYAKEKGIDESEIPGWRLVEDMLPLSFQIQTCSNTAKNSIARITKAELPKWEDDEKTLDDLYARINKTIELLKSVDAKTFEGKENEEIILKTGGAEYKFTGTSYLQANAIPNFYFHAATAYDILRLKGVPVGKKNYLYGGFTSLGKKL